MKKVFLPLFVIFFFSISVSAQEPCATIMPEEQLEWLREYKTNPFNSHLKSRSNTAFNIPIKFHVVGDNSGNGYYRPRQIVEAICNLNDQYLPVGFYFYLIGDINYINNSSLYNHNGYNVGNIISQHNVTNAVNIYFVENPAGACGYYSGWGGRPYIAIAKSCGNIGNTTIAHEVGHYFSLPHTFNGWEGKDASVAAGLTDERVDGSNCAFRGDFFCDTPADFISNRWLCPYTGTKTDYVGNPYNPDGSLYMSYSNDNCQNKFSNEQIDAMIQYLTSNSRSFLLNQTFPDTSITGTIELLHPANSATNVPSNYVNLKWNRVEGAQLYHVMVSRFSHFNNTNVDILTSDTSLLVTNLSAGLEYRWKVRPINYGNFCREYSQEFTFRASSPTVINPKPTVTPVSCSNSNDGAIVLDPEGGAGPYEVYWSTGEIGTSITGLLYGTYYATVFDNNGASLEVSLDVINPDPLEIVFDGTPNVVTAIVSGGTPPYTYTWNNGVTVPSNGISPGQYFSLTVTDAKGCISSKDSDGYTSVKEVGKNMLSGLKVFPNPLAGFDKVNITFTLRESQTVSVTVYDFSGKVVYEQKSWLTQGEHLNTFETSGLNRGIYLIKLSGNQDVLTRKLVVQ